MYRFLQKPVPDELFISNISGLGAPSAQTPPTALLRPTLDGEDTSYFEWLGAGALEIRDDVYRGGDARGHPTHLDADARAVRLRP